MYKIIIIYTILSTSLIIAYEVPDPYTICGRNEVYKCGGYCDRSCNGSHRFCPIKTIQCKYDCYCKEGYARNFMDICIPVKYCKWHTTCPENQTFHGQLPSCPADMSCDLLLNKNVGDSLCEKDEIVTFDIGCTCKTGFIRDFHEPDCIRPEECCKQSNTVLLKYPNPCPGNTCEHPEFKNCTEPRKRWECQCKKGFVKENEGSLNCIPLSECKTISDPIKD